MRTLLLTLTALFALSFSACAQKSPIVHADWAMFNARIADLETDTFRYIGDKPAVIDFYASWCGPCKRISPILERLAKKYEGQIIVYKIDVDKEQRLAGAFNITSIPTLMFVPVGGEPIMNVGFMDEAEIESAIQTIMTRE